MFVEAKMEDYLFSTPEGAIEKSKEIGFDGEIHESTLADGTKLYSPAKTEEEFITWYRKNDPDAEEEFEAAEYQGRKVKLNKPFRTPNEKKKFAVYVKNPAGKVIIVRFGDPNMEIKRDDPKRRKAFRDRHNCTEKKDKTTAGYWSCKMWERGKSVTDYTSSEFNKTDDSLETVMGGCGELEADCGCGCTKTHEAAEPTPSSDETHNEYMSRCQEAGYSEEECMKAHEGHDFKEEASYHTDSGSCKAGYEKKDGMCVKVAFELDIDIDVSEIMIEAETGRQVVRISGIAFHEGMNKNGWQITRAGADLAVPQMIGADLTLNHPPSESGHFKRNMNGDVEDAVVGIVTEASIIDKMGGQWEVRFKADVYRTELFEALESGLWLRQGYGVSIGGTGVPDEIAEAEDGQMIMTFESDFSFDHLAIVHRPAYNRANIETAERITLKVANYEAFNSHTHNGKNNEKVNLMSEEEMTVIEASEETVVETPNYEAEIEALKASLASREEELNAIKAAEEAKAEEGRLALVEKATEMGIAGVSELPAETINSIIASFEAARPEVDMKPVVASESVEVEESPVSDEPVVANFLNRRKVETPESIYEKAYNVWATAYRKAYSGENFTIPLYAEAKEKMML
jgi:hypothetical protein